MLVKEGLPFGQLWLFHGGWLSISMHGFLCGCVLSRLLEPARAKGQFCTT
jgi:hypothetical protein